MPDQPEQPVPTEPAEPADAAGEPARDPDVPPEAWSGVHRGPLRAGEWVRLTDTKGRRHNFELVPGKRFFSNRGHLEHDDLIGREEGFTLASSAGGEYLVFRPLLSEFVVSMPRGAAVVYPKDAAQIVALADIFPGARVVEAGVGSGALTCSLLRAVGPFGRVTSYERREEFAEVAQRNVHQFFGAPEGSSHPAWQLRLGNLAEALPASGERCDRIILDMLAPWECLDAAADALVPGGIVCAYVATTTQLSRFVETVRAHGGFTEPQPWESLVRDWHVEGLAVRPGHKMIGHTAFLVTARRMAPGERPPRKTRRPAPGAYGPDYSGPRPPDVPVEEPASD
ncbi:tRNA (adenine-N1)-methyltransferase [Nocardioides kribbensis]